ncbi:MAG: amidohydrolase, partial [Chloroflexia bacterium]|nr:amidohydrolase [Chloroflexia bacterium]
RARPRGVPERPRRAGAPAGGRHPRGHRHPPRVEGRLGQRGAHRQRHPHRRELDAMIPHHPVLIHRACNHIALANSQALALAGITAQTADPVGGRIGRDADGEPNGVLEESAVALVRAVVQKPPIDWQRGIAHAMPEYHKRGITAIGEAALGHINGIDDLHVMQQAQQNGNLALRVAYMGYGAVANAWLAGQELIVDDDWQQAPIIKFFSDGTLGGGSAWMSTAYRDEPGNRGYPLYSDEDLIAAFTRAHCQGYQIAVHVIGDAAVAQALRCFAAVLTAYPRYNHRHRLEHCESLRPGLAAQCAQLGIVVGVQPIFTWFEESDVARIPDMLMPYAHAWKTLHDAGAVLAFGSDNPVVPDFHPLKGIAAAVTRQTWRGDVINAPEALAWQTAIDAYTYGAAYSLQAEQRYGDLRRGLCADFVVIDDNPALPLAQHQVIETWIDGKLL